MIYLASPYNSPYLTVRQKRYEAAQDAAADMVRRNPLRAVYSPIVHWHYTAQSLSLSPGLGFWKAQNRAMLVFSTQLYVLCLDGWKHSRGISHELRIATDLQLPILLWKGPEHDPMLWPRNTSKGEIKL